MIIRIGILFSLWVMVGIPQLQAKTLDSCQAVASFAENAMAARQSGYRLTQAISFAEGYESYYQRKAEALVLTAYQKPNVPNPRHKLSIIQRFKSDALTKCLQGVVLASRD